MRMALCGPSSQSVFQKTPGRGSTQGTVFVFTKRLTGGVVTGAVSFRAVSASGVAEGLLDGVAELGEGQGALDLALVDEERGGGAHAGLAPLPLIGEDRVAEPPGVEAFGERGGVEPEPSRVADQVVAGEVGLGHEEQVVVLPVAALGTRAAGRERGGQCTGVGAQREVLEHESYGVGKLTLQLVEDLLRALAEGALVVTPLEDR